MQLSTIDGLRQLMPEGASEIFSSGDDAVEKIDVCVQIPMIDAIDDDVLQPLQIDHHPCFRIDAPFDADLKEVVVTMAGRVVALVICAAVPLRIVFRIVQAVRGGERESGCNDHRSLMPTAGGTQAPCALRSAGPGASVARRGNARRSGGSRTAGWP